MHYFPFKRGTPRKRPALEWYRILLLVFYEIAGKSMSRRKMKEIAKPLEDKSKIRVAQPGGGFDERIEDGGVGSHEAPWAVSDARAGLPTREYQQFTAPRDRGHHPAGVSHPGLSEAMVRLPW